MHCTAARCRRAFNVMNLAPSLVSCLVEIRNWSSKVCSKFFCNKIANMPIFKYLPFEFRDKIFIRHRSKEADRCMNTFWGKCGRSRNRCAPGKNESELFSSSLREGNNTDTNLPTTSLVTNFHTNKSGTKIKEFTRHTLGENGQIKTNSLCLQTKEETTAGFVCTLSCLLMLSVWRKRGGTWLYHLSSQELPRTITLYQANRRGSPVTDYFVLLVSLTLRGFTNNLWHSTLFYVSPAFSLFFQRKERDKWK